ncbi:cation:proton antiporter [Falsiroseomonas sp. CW058]|uniref:cation:proton antiporter domain-containing protein n=1 Tax=Falsiroseomonas sp. CW058 TaxID=3388664 RepID=UPI003D3104BC
MEAGHFVALLLAGIGPLLALARIAKLPATLVLAGAGVAVGLLPGPPLVRLDPGIAIALFLPPIIYAGNVRITPLLLRRTLLPGGLVGVLVALAVIGATALVARWMLPDLGGPQAVLLGVVAALFDTRIFHEAEGRPHVPRAVADALKAREIAARVVALTVFSLALEALSERAPPGLGEAALDIAWSLAGGAAAGIAIGRAVLWLRDRAGPAPIEIAVSLAAPYLAALAAEWLALSLAVSVIAAALTVSAARVDPETGEARSSAETRIAAAAFWEEASLLASAVLFFFAGLALPEALAGLGFWPLARVAGAAAAILALVLLVQWLGSLAAAHLPPLSAALEEADAATRGGAAGVMAWASTLSVIGLIAALSIPATLPDGEPTPGRDLVLVLAALVILGSVLVQGLTLRAVVRRAGLSAPAEAKAEEEKARGAAAAARDRAPDAPEEAGRRALLRLHERDEIGDESLRKALRESDLRERAAEGGGTGAGPPQP